MTLSGRVALVTGASRGIGEAIALALATAGADVIVTDIQSRAEGGEALAASLRGSGFRSSFAPLDVTNVQQCEEAIGAAAESHGRLDILVNNAGIRLPGPALQTAESDFDATLAVNLKGTFFCAVAAARRMLPARYGRIVNIASQLAITGVPDRAAYCASKGGVAALTRALAVEWGRSGITVNAVGPGPTTTPLWDDDPRSEAEKLRHIESHSPLGRFLTPREVASAAVYLCTEDAGGITGHLLLVDGGWTAQ